MIPAIIIPTLNQPIFPLLESIDHPVEKVVVIDNGSHIHPYLAEGDFPFDLQVIDIGHNLGVAASWNLGIKATPHAAWWLISNDDITFGPGDLARWDEAVEPRSARLHLMLGMAVFAVTPPLLAEVGWFDEAFINAYDEDVDYQRRCELAGIPRVECGFTGSHVGSATIFADQALRAWNGRSHGSNDAYYARKWGGHKLGGELFTTPFGRGGSVREWEGDVSRLREFTWPRK